MSATALCFRVVHHSSTLVDSLRFIPHRGAGRLLTSLAGLITPLEKVPAVNPRIHSHLNTKRAQPNHLFILAEPSDQYDQYIPSTTPQPPRRPV